MMASNILTPVVENRREQSAFKEILNLLALTWTHIDR